MAVYVMGALSTLAAAEENLTQTGGTSEYRQGKYAGSS